MPSSLTISIGQHSDKGTKAENQDFFGIAIPNEPQLSTKGIIAAIADGVSSCEAGRQASESCVSGLIEDYLSTPESWTVKTSGHKVLGALNNWLYSRGRQYDSKSATMVTTLSALVLKSIHAHIFHVGDSRIYRLQGNSLECLTNDHRTNMGEGKSYLTRAMGIDIHLDIDYRKIEIEAGDFFLFTTDGIHDFVSDKSLVEIIKNNISNLGQCCETIVKAALRNNSNDNLTCQLIRIDSLPNQDADSVYKELTRLPFPPPLNPGQILDGYRIESEIHASKRTQVYRATDLDTQTTVVIKTPSVNFEDDPAYIESFIREEWAGKRLNNKHIVKIHGAGKHKQFLYYVTEYIDGVTLRQWMKEHPQPDIKEVRELVKQIVSGVQAFHRHEMLHQDLKPENIMLTREGRVKIIDFGSTKIAGIAEINTPIERIHLLGTRNYTAPEYQFGYPGSNHSDIFSLGVITYELLTGKLPYGKALEKNLNKKNIGRLQYHQSYHYNSMIPIWLDKAIEKAVNPNPQHRYAELSEFINDMTKPNPAFLTARYIPLLERDPIRFWKTSTLIVTILCVVLLLLLLN